MQLILLQLVITETDIISLCIANSYREGMIIALLLQVDGGELYPIELGRNGHQGQE